jgi:hypothetical protein
VGEFADCQEMFDHFLARSFSDLTYGGFHRVFVDLYSLQHPDKYCDSAKSLAAHLTGLCCVVEHDGDVRVNAALRKWLNGRMELEKPAMPEGRGDATIDRFVGMDDADVAAKFEEWCAEVWDAHSERHELALRWISLAFGD